jgi:membrane-bound ClpP family serine protease
MELLRLITSINPIQALFIIVGLALVIIEMFHPGFGAPGITGGIMLFVGIALIAKTIPQALILILLILAILGIALTLVLHSATKGNLAKRLVLSNFQNKEAGYIGTEALEYFLDKEGTAITVLRPSGTVDFDGVRVDVVSEGSFIPAGKRVRVIKVEGRRIVVKEAVLSSIGV